MLRVLPDAPYGPTKHIILATERMTLQRGIRLLRDVGQSEAGLITATLGSGITDESHNKVLSVSATTTSTSSPQFNKKKKKRKKSKLCLEFGPCEHHGPKSLHATCECEDPTLSRRKKNRNKSASAAPDTTQNLIVAPTGPQASMALPPMPQPYFGMPYPCPSPLAANYPPMVYHPLHQSYMQNQLPTQVTDSTTSTCLVIQATTSTAPKPMKVKRRRRTREELAKIYVARAEAFCARKDAEYAAEEARKAKERQAAIDARNKEKEADRQRALSEYSDRMYARARRYAGGAGAAVYYQTYPADPDSDTDSDEPHEDSDSDTDVDESPPRDPYARDDCDSDYESDSTESEAPPLVPKSDQSSPSNFDDDSDDSDSTEPEAPALEPYDQSSPSEFEYDDDDEDQNSDSTAWSISDYDLLQDLIGAIPDSDNEYDGPPVTPLPSSQPDNTSGPDYANLSDESDLQPQQEPPLSRCHQLMAEAYQSPGRIFTHADNQDFNIDSVENITLHATCITYVLSDNGLVAMPPTVPILIHTVKPKASSESDSRPANNDDDDRTTNDSSATEDEPTSTPIILREATASEGDPIAVAVPVPSNSSSEAAFAAEFATLDDSIDFQINHSPPDTRKHAAAEPITEHGAAKATLPQDPGGSPLSETLPYNPVRAPDVSDTVSPSPVTSRYYAVASGTTTGIFLTETEMLQHTTDPATGKPLPDAMSGAFSDIESATAFLLSPGARKKAKTKRRKPTNYHWSQKGTKKSRREARRKKQAKSASTTFTFPQDALSPPRTESPPQPPPRSSPPSSVSSDSFSPRIHASVSRPSPSTPISKSSTKAQPSPATRPICAVDGCHRRTGKRKYGYGHFTYCFKHRHLSISPSPMPNRFPVPVCMGADPMVSPINANVEIQDVTDHIQMAHTQPIQRERDLDLSIRFPQLRRSRKPFAVAQGLHTEYNYPQQFLVTLRGDPIVRNDWTVAPCMVRGNTSAREAINHVLHAVANRDINPRTLCNHLGCIYNQGDLLSRRRRFQAAIDEINGMLCQPDGEPPSPPSKTLLIIHATCPDIVLDSGAARHVHNKAKDFKTT